MEEANPPQVGGGVVSFQAPTPATGSGLIAVGADAGNAPLVKVFDAATLKENFEFLAYPSTSTGGVRVAVADVNGDGTDDIITALASQDSQVRIFDGKTGVPFKGPLGQFSTFARGYARRFSCCRGC